MSRKDDKGKDSTAIVTVNIDDFTRTRDRVIVSLATLQSAVSDLSRAYINHANTVLNRGPSTLDLGGISLLENGLLGGRLSPGRSDGGEVKKKRKRAPHDPNAPKRALTPYFLYMQHNRSQIASELGSSARPKEVADEGTRRWAEMPDAEKQVWKRLYADNLAVYKERMKAYKAGLPLPEDDTTEAASKQLQQGVNLATEEASSDESDEEEREEASPEPVKEPTPPRTNKRRRATGDAKSAAAPSPVAPSKKASPDKRKRATGGRKDAEEKPKRGSAAAGASETPKAAIDKRSKKKRRSEAVVNDD